MPPVLGPVLLTFFATRRKNFSQWHHSFQRKLRSHWLKFLRHVAITLVIQGPGNPSVDMQRPCDRLISTMVLPILLSSSNMISSHDVDLVRAQYSMACSGMLQKLRRCIRCTGGKVLESSLFNNIFIQFCLVLHFDIWLTTNGLKLSYLYGRYWWCLFQNEQHFDKWTALNLLRPSDVYMRQ